MGNYCKYITRPGDIQEYESCVYSCSTNECNSAHMAQINMTFYYIMVLGLVIYNYWYFLFNWIKNGKICEFAKFYSQ